MKALLLEEAYELIDAVQQRDFDEIKDELGDLLFTAVFYARLAEEEGHFGIDDVVEHAHAKLVRRHPHVFGEDRASTAEEALQSWLKVKEGEKQARNAQVDAAQDGSKSHLDGLAPTFPSTLEAYEIGVRAAEMGFDWKRIEDVLDKVQEEIAEIREELKGTGADTGRRLESEVGDLLFAAACLARHVRSDPETCLRAANRKFMNRFRAMEREVAKRGQTLRDCSLEDLEAVWQTIKGSHLR
jgi:nucleoside triphosphate diphosphatase